MTITNPENARVALENDSAEAARRTLTALSVGAVAPEAFPGKLRCQSRLTTLAQSAFDRARSEATAIAAAARADIDTVRRSELKANPFAAACMGGASRSVGSMPAPLDAADVQIVITSRIDDLLARACRDLDRITSRKLKTKKGVERRRKRLKVEIDAFVQRLQPVLAAHVAGHVRDELADELRNRYEACVRSRDALQRLCAEATDPGEDIPGSHRFSCGPRVEVVLKAAAVRRPDLLDSEGVPTDAIWPAFGAEVAAGDLGVMEDPQAAIDALLGFLESTVADALTGVMLDGLYSMTGEQPEVQNWIQRAGARLQVAASAPEPYRVRLAQVPATTSEILYDHVLHHIQTATRSEESNRLQLVELTYAFRASEVLDADPRGIHRVLADIRPHASNPRLAEALRTWSPSAAVPDASREDSTERTAADNGRSRLGTTTPA
jgi:hypothetical protein